MVKRGQLSTETLRWLSDSWMLYIQLYSPGSWEAPLYTLSVHLFYEFTIQCPEAHSLYIKINSLTWVCAAIERCLRSRIAPRLFWQLVATCYVCMHMCATVCVSVCARRAPAHIGQQTRGRLSSGSSVRRECEDSSSSLWLDVSTLSLLCGTKIVCMYAFFHPLLKLSF